MFETKAQRQMNECCLLLKEKPPPLLNECEKEVYKDPDKGALRDEATVLFLTCVKETPW